VLEIGLDLVLVARVGVDDVPAEHQRSPPVWIVLAARGTRAAPADVRRANLGEDDSPPTPRS
jgi:hypothetical protein